MRRNIATVFDAIDLGKIEFHCFIISDDFVDLPLFVKCMRIAKRSGIVGVFTNGSAHNGNRVNLIRVDRFGSDCQGLGQFVDWP